MVLAITVSSVNPRAGRSGNLVFALFAFVVYFNLLNLGPELDRDRARLRSAFVLAPARRHLRWHGAVAGQATQQLDAGAAAAPRCAGRARTCHEDRSGA